jgi:hypothetical protein
LPFPRRYPCQQRLIAPVGSNVSGLFLMAGFELTLYGRIWVTPKALASHCSGGHPHTIRRMTRSFALPPVTSGSGFSNTTPIPGGAEMHSCPTQDEPEGGVEYPHDYQVLPKRVAARYVRIRNVFSPSRRTERSFR